MCSVVGETPTQLEELTDITVVGLEEPVKKKKDKKHREKRKRSCSTDSTSSISSHRRHKKKKKKKKRDDDPPSPRVNPIFLWVKQDDTKIVEVLCEDYDKRNRIRLTKTAAGWVAIPRTERLCSMTSREDTSSREDEEEEKRVESSEEVEEPKDSPEIQKDVESEVRSEEVKEQECTEVKCCTDANVDENHNNEIIVIPDSPEMEKSIEEDVEEVKIIPDDPPETIEIEDDVEEVEEVDESEEEEEEEEDCKSHQESCVNLMNELADMCFVENLKETEREKELSDIYTFVPSPSVEKDEKKFETPIEEVKKPDPDPSEVATPEPSPINLVVHPQREVASEDEPKMEPLKQSDLDSLDIIWRLPEGTTICHSKPLPDTKPGEHRRTPQTKPPPTFSQPVQEEPLNLGKPKPKTEKPEKVEKKKEDSKLLELLQTDDKVQSNPLEQLKEVLSDPDLTVPDPLLVPRARLSALIANPAKEIPRLLSQKREVKYPKVDTDLMVVSLAHLQSLLQQSGQEEELKLYHQQMMSGLSHEKMDATTAALSQMLWLPYLSQLEAQHNQEVMAMLYPHYMYPQSYAHPPTPTMRYPYARSPWPRAQTSKPPLPVLPPPPNRPKQSHTPQTKHPPTPQPRHPPTPQPKQPSTPQPKQPPTPQPMQPPTPQPMQPPPPPTPPESPKPKLKLRDIGGLVEPKLRQNLINFEPPPPFLQNVAGVPPNSNLWHPLFSSPDGKYTSRWNWTTPVTVSGE